MFYSTICDADFTEIFQDGNSLMTDGRRNPNRRLTEGFSTHLNDNPRSAIISRSSLCNTLTSDFVNFWCNFLILRVILLQIHGS